MPAAAIDASGNLAVTWYDNRRHQTVADSLGGTHYLLDLFATTSFDGAVTFSPPFQVNDAANPFDPLLALAHARPLSQATASTKALSLHAARSSG